MNLPDIDTRLREFDVHIDLLGSEVVHTADLVTQNRAFGHMDDTLRVGLRPHVRQFLGQGRGTITSQYFVTKRFLLQKTLIQVMRELPPTKE